MEMLKRLSACYKYHLNKYCILLSKDKANLGQIPYSCYVIPARAKSHVCQSSRIRRSVLWWIPNPLSYHTTEIMELRKSLQDIFPFILVDTSVCVEWWQKKSSSTYLRKLNMDSRLWSLDRVTNSNFSEHIVPVHSVIICAFSFPAVTLVFMQLKRITYFKEG